MIARRNKVCNIEVYKKFSYLFDSTIRQKDYLALFASEVQKFIGVNHVSFTPSGRKGLSLILDFFNFPSGSEIILPAYTLKDLAFLIKNKGFIPTFVDIDSKTLNIDASLLENKITEKTVAIIPTHLFGMPCEIDKIVSMARRHNVIVIEDCAHAFGARYKSQHVGTFGDAGFFSLELSKPVNTFGGGVVTSQRKDIIDFIQKEVANYPAPKTRLIRKVCASAVEDIIVHSFLFNILAYLFYFPFSKKIITSIYGGFSQKVNIADFAYDNFQAYLGLGQLKHLETRNRLLIDKVKKMRSLINREVHVQQNLFDSIPAFYFNILYSSKNAFEVRQYLLRKGIDCGVQDEVEDNCPTYFNDPGEYPVTDRCYAKVVQLPMSGTLTDRQIKKIADVLNEAL